jgi:thiamine pyrophosphokinase
MAERTWVILAAGEWCHLHRIESWLRSAECVVACDGALDAAHANNVHVDLVIGDMDSVAEATLQVHEETGGKVRRVSGQDNNDLAKAFAHASAGDVDRCVVVGATGGDLHHAWANLLESSRTSTEIVCLTPEHVYRFLKPQRKSSIELGAGADFSVFSTHEARGVSVRGAEWELEDAVLTAGSRGLHNKATEATVEIEFQSGGLFVLHGYRGDEGKNERSISE